MMVKNNEQKRKGEFNKLLAPPKIMFGKCERIVTH